MSDWQPLATAPKDGTMIAVHSWFFVFGKRYRFLSLAHWASGEVGDLAPDWRDEDGVRIGVDEKNEEWLWHSLDPLPAPPEPGG